MKTREELQAMVDRLKVTNTVFCGLPKNEQEFIEKNLHDCVEIDVYGCWTEAEQPIHSCMLLRVRSDFQLPPEPVKERTVKWFNCDTGRTLDCSEGICPGEAWVEVPVKVEPTFDSIIERLEQVIKELKEHK